MATKAPADGDSSGNVKLVQTSYKARAAAADKNFEKLRDVPFPGGVDLQFIIKELAKDLDLNVLFDSGSRLRTAGSRSTFKCSAAQALDYIFLQEGFSFKRSDRGRSLLLKLNRRANFQQFVLRTFYLQNADPAKIKPLIQQAIPAQPGRSQTIVMDDARRTALPSAIRKKTFG